MNSVFDDIVITVFTTIQAMEKEREQQLRAPFHVMYGDLVRRMSIDGITIREALNLLWKQQKIKIGRTINDRYISTNGNR